MNKGFLISTAVLFVLLAIVRSIIVAALNKPSAAD